MRLVKNKNVAVDSDVHRPSNDRVNHVLVRSDYQIGRLSQLPGCIVRTCVHLAPKPLQVFYVVHLGPQASATALAQQWDMYRANTFESRGLTNREVYELVM